MKKVLIIDDDATSRNGFSEIVSAAGFSAMEASSGKEGINIFEKEDISTVLIDLVMPEMGGIQTMQALKEANPEVPLIMISAHGDIPTAVEATKRGAYDFITKPPDFENFVAILKRAIEKRELRREVNRLHSILENSLGNLLGVSESIQRIKQEVQQVAQSDFSIIIQGETGTGKTTLAREIHHLSKRHDKPFVKVDIGTLAESLMESELFGHEKGSFTGADKRKKGFFETANEGTIFIDEIENMSHSTQSKLLNVVEEKNIYTVGSSKPVKIDFRLIAATNSDLKRLLHEKKMREDLYYRLGEFIVTIPPLRERTEDIHFFARKFLADACDELNKSIEDISDEAMCVLSRHPWPGNIRELKNIVRKAVLFSEEDTLKAENIRALFSTKSVEGEASPDLPLKDALKIQEKNMIKNALKTAKGNKTRAAALLQTSYRNLLFKIKEYDIDF